MTIQERLARAVPRCGITSVPRKLRLLFTTLTVLGAAFILTGFLLRDGTFSLNKEKMFLYLRLQNKGNNLFAAEQKCRPKSHIVFLKTHKTESTLIQNILYRYGESRNLTFALPQNQSLKFSYPEHFEAKFVEGVDDKTGTKFDIVCNHMRFRKSEVKKVMPKDSFYFSIMRHPALMLQSVFMLYKGSAVFSGLHEIDDLIVSSMETYNTTDENFNLTPNNLAFDFGYENHVTADTEGLADLASEVIMGIEDDFDLILIHEYLDQSLVLLRHALCWSLEDVVMLKRHSRGDQPFFPVSPETAEKIIRWNALDWTVYQHFNATFWQKVETLVGMEEMMREVSELRALQAELTHTCMKGKFPGNLAMVPGLKLEWTEGEINLGHNINQDLDEQTKRKCHKFVRPEFQYMYSLYNQQFSEKTEL